MQGDFQMRHLLNCYPRTYTEKHPCLFRDEINELYYRQNVLHLKSLESQYIFYFHFSIFANAGDNLWMKLKSKHVVYFFFIYTLHTKLTC